MICSTCQHESSHIYYKKGREYCPHCAGIPENRTTDDLITRASSRIRMESLKFEGDMLNPQRYDKASKKVVPNEEFLKRNGTRAQNFFKEDELSSTGYQKLSKAIVKEKKAVRRSVEKFKADVIHSGESKQRIKELLK